MPTSYGKKYTSRIMIDGRIIHLGSFDTVEEAQQARIKKENEIFGDFSYYNTVGE